MSYLFPAYIPDAMASTYISNVKRKLRDIVMAHEIILIKIDESVFFFDSTTLMLWFIYGECLTLAKARACAQEIVYADISGWRLPNISELAKFAKNPKNPLRSGNKYRLRDQCYWLTSKGKVDLDSTFLDSALAVGSGSSGDAEAIFCVDCDVKSIDEFIDHAVRQGWECFVPEQKSDILSPLRQFDPKIALADLDYLTCRQPKLEDAVFTDPNKGLWEAWGSSTEDQAKWGVRGRNPAQDVQEGYVAIDFGTSSTVVAWDNNGRAELMRIGVKDFWEKQKPSDYENPTVLEFIDLPKMLESWNAVAYRPMVSWDHVRCSHEALHNWRNSETDPRVVGSILGKIKQWALRQQNDHRLRITDQINAQEHELAPLSPRNPVKGVPLEVRADDPFDPIELYAWFLGMNVNWRQRGIFLRYFMSFPVDYPQAVKDNILAAFRRGLQRSLPSTLINQAAFQDFSVEERASEPAAYAAIALPELDIQPSEGSGIGYAVFDFGGGTADFDFGFYRLPTADEEEEGWEAVFERCGTAGDKFLGGENLLENMAYQTFRENLDICRKYKIAFTRPLDAPDFPGSEMFLERTRAAATNTMMLMSRLRPLWETGSIPGTESGVTRIDLLNRDGVKVSCDFAVSPQLLLSFLEQRIEKGVHGFYAALKSAFGSDLPAEVHVLLAGNASRSTIVSDLFGLGDDQSEAFQRTQNYLQSLFKQEVPAIKPYRPLAADEDNVYRPTGKTGVALGLLRLCPGTPLKVVDHAKKAAGNEAPFAYHVGRTQQRQFKPGIPQGTPYGEWHLLGVPRERVFHLFYTQSPIAHTGSLKEGDQELSKRSLHLAGEASGHKVFGRATKPDQIEVCTAVSKEAAQNGEFENLQQIQLG